jgi:hypothetical protein
MKFNWKEGSEHPAGMTVFVVLMLAGLVAALWPAYALFVHLYGRGGMWRFVVAMGGSSMMYTLAVGAFTWAAFGVGILVGMLANWFKRSPPGK